jgi:hypothetical protein
MESVRQWAGMRASSCPTALSRRRQVINGPADPVTSDINAVWLQDFTPGQHLHGHDDWSRLDYKFCDNPTFGALVHGPMPDEITLEMQEDLNEILPPYCVADLDGSREVDVIDFLILLAAWGQNPGDPADFDGDGFVGVTDFLIMLGNWGPCP